MTVDLNQHSYAKYRDSKGVSYLADENNAVKYTTNCDLDSQRQDTNNTHYGVTKV